MKTRMLVLIINYVLALVFITGSCATTTEIKEKDDIKPEVFLQVVKNGDGDEVKRLIEAGADVNAQSKKGVTALMLASLMGHPEVAKLLIEAGADVNEKEKLGVTALMLTSGQGHPDVAKLLIKAGADVNEKDNEGWTALMGASGQGHTEVAELLKEAGAK